MNASKFSSVLALGVALSLVATGCKHNPPPITHFHDNTGLAGSNGDNLGNGGALPNNGPTPIGGGEAAIFNPDDMAQDRSAFAAETLYFDLDSSAIRSSDESKLSAVASALKSDASAKLLIE